MKPNLGWLFYKGYYHKDSNLADVPERKKAAVQALSRFFFAEPSDALSKEKKEAIAVLYRTTNKKFLQREFDSREVKSLPENHYSHYIRLRTTYPGLMSGTGYAHGVKQEGEFKIGFYFDHTTGLPVLPGSSVKGMLKAAFDDRDYIRQICQEVLVGKELNAEQIEKLETEIFAGKGADGKMLSPYRRDIFFDAMLSTENAANKKFLGDDSITPHAHPLKDPNPLLFLKVLPGVLFDFKFALHPSVQKNADKHPLLTAKDKRDIFEKILLDFGVGAKTNVGYGQLSRPSDAESTPVPSRRSRTLDEFKRVLEDVFAQKSAGKEGLSGEWPTYFTGRIRQGAKPVDAEYLGPDPANSAFKRMKLFIAESGKEQIAVLKFKAELVVGRKASVEIGELNKDGTVKTVNILQWK